MDYFIKISNHKFTQGIHHLHLAREPIVAYSVVFAVQDSELYNAIMVYANQNAGFDGGNPWAIGIAQNNAQPGEIVEVIYTGMSKVRFFSRNVPVNTNIYIQQNGAGACCLIDEDGVDVLTREDGQAIMVGHVLPRTQPIMGSTFEHRSMIVDVWIQIATTPMAPAEN